MIDMEKVVNGLRHCLLYNGSCLDYPYDGPNCQNDVLEDVVALLKEQEAVEPYMDYDGHDVWRCGNCGATIFHIEHSQADEDWKSYAKFCRQCGREVKWDE